MTDNQIKQLAIKFRKAIEIAHQKGLFSYDIALDDFPTGSCGDVSYLLAEYLKRNGIAWTLGPGPNVVNLTST